MEEQDNLIITKIITSKQLFVEYEEQADRRPGLLLELYDSENVVGMADRESFGFRLAEPLFPYAGNPSHNQQHM